MYLNACIQVHTHVIALMATLEYNVKPIGTSAGLCHAKTEQHALMELRVTTARVPTVSQVN